MPLKPNLSVSVFTLFPLILGLLVRRLLDFRQIRHLVAVKFPPELLLRLYPIINSFRLPLRVYGLDVPRPHRLYAELERRAAKHGVERAQVATVRLDHRLELPHGRAVGEPRPDTWIRVAVAIILLGVLIAVAAGILVKMLKKVDRGYPNELREELPPEEEKKKETKPQKRSADPRKRMRYLYADFLKRVRRTVPKATETDPIEPQGGFGGDESALARWKSELSSISAGSSIAGHEVLMQERYRNELSSRMMRHFDRKPMYKRRLIDAPKAYETNTCGEIRTREEERKRAKRLDLSEFTALYEKARYRLKEEPKNEDAARMKALYEEIKKSY